MRRSARLRCGGRRAGSLVAALLCTALAAAEACAADRACVVLLHGLARTAASMTPVAEALRGDYVVVNVDYPSREAPVAVLAERAVGDGVARCGGLGARPVHFVTHSLGGILVRHYLTAHALPELGRVVMLAPPNAGSEVVDALRDMPGFLAYNGPAGLELGTDAASVPRRLGPATFSLGVIAGTVSYSPLATLLPEPNDGKVSLASTRLEGMADFLAVPATHTFIMGDEVVLGAIRRFLRDGHFGGEERAAAP